MKQTRSHESGVLSVILLPIELSHSRRSFKSNFSFHHFFVGMGYDTAGCKNSCISVSAVAMTTANNTAKIHHFSSFGTSRRGYTYSSVVRMWTLAVRYTRFDDVTRRRPQGLFDQRCLTCRNHTSLSA